MKKSILQLVLIVSFSLIFSSQIFSQIRFNHIYGGPSTDEAYSIVETYDGGFVFTGMTASYGIAFKNVWIVKIDTQGDTLWTKTYGINWVEETYKIIQMPDSGFALIGKSTSASNGLYNDFWLLRTDQMGDTLWTKFFGDLLEQETPTNIIRTADGGFAIIGFDNDNVNNGSIWLVKTDANGDTMWTKKYGGPYSEGASGILQTADGGYLICGSINWSYISPNWQLYLIKTDTNGDTLWTKSYGAQYTEHGYDLINAVGSGYFIAAGKYHYYNGHSSSDIWLLKISDNGDSLWSKYYGNDEDETPTSIHRTLDGNYIIGGRIGVGNVLTDGMFLVKVDSLGDTLFTSRFGGDSNDWGSDAIPTSDGGFILCGYTNSFGAQNRDAWIVSIAEPDYLNNNILNSPASFQLYQNYPNPFNPTTKISYNLPNPGFVTLTIFDYLGKEIQTPVSENHISGNHTIEFDGSTLASGIYFYQLKLNNEYLETKKMLLLK